MKIPSQRTLENLTSKTAVQIPSKKTNSRKSNLRFPRKILYYVFYNFIKKSVSWLLTPDSGPAFHWFVSATIRTMRENCVTTARTTWRQEAQPAPRWSDTSFQIHLFIWKILLIYSSINTWSLYIIFLTRRHTLKMEKVDNSFTQEQK